MLGRHLAADSGLKVSSIAFVLHSSEKELFVCFPGEAKISVRTVIREPSIRFSTLSLIHFLAKSSCGGGHSTVAAFLLPTLLESWLYQDFFLFIAEFVNKPTDQTHLVLSYGHHKCIQELKTTKKILSRSHWKSVRNILSVM